MWGSLPETGSRETEHGAAAATVPRLMYCIYRGRPGGGVNVAQWRQLCR